MDRQSATTTTSLHAAAAASDAPALASAPSRTHVGQFVEFFAGIGLMREGLAPLGWRPALANDICPRKAAAYRARFPQPAAVNPTDSAAHADSLIVADIRDLKPADLPAVDLATASFPCTDLSLAGGRRGIHQGESSAFWPLVHLLDQLGDRRPPRILLENVTGFLTSHQGEDFRQALAALNQLGYAVDPIILDARWFVPQSRPRLFVVGRRFATPPDAPRLSPADLQPSRIRPPRLIQAISQLHPDIRFDLADLPQPPDASPHTLADILENLPDDDPAWWSAERAAYLLSQMSPRHRAVADDMIAQPRITYGAVFRRVRKQPDGHKRSMAELRTDGLAGCLRTPKGGSAKQILFKAGAGRYAARLLTPTECARLMGAAPVNTPGTANDALFGFGDAVCVPAVTWIARHAIQLQPADQHNHRPPQ